MGDDWGEAMRRLHTDPGVSREELDEIKAGILRLAGLPAGPRRRCESEACDEYDGIHCYGDGCALVRREAT